MNERDELFELAEDMGIDILNARTKDDAKIIAIHLLNPDMRALEDAIFQAEKDLFTVIMIHNKQTWPFNINKEKVESGQKLLA